MNKNLEEVIENIKKKHKNFYKEVLLQYCVSKSKDLENENLIKKHFKFEFDFSLDTLNGKLRFFNNRNLKNNP